MASDNNGELSEDIIFKFEELEDSFQSLKDFTFERLNSFRQKVKEVENKQFEHVSEVRDEMSKMSDHYSSLEGSRFRENYIPKPPLPIASSTPGKPVCSRSEEPCRSPPNPTFNSKVNPRHNYKRPVHIEDVNQAGLRDALIPFYPKTVDIREKLSKVQIAYVLLWMDNCPSVTGRKEDARQLFEAGIRNNIWTRSYVGEGITDPLSYFAEKIRTIIRKQRRVSQKRLLNEEFEICSQALNLNLSCSRLYFRSDNT